MYSYYHRCWPTFIQYLPTMYRGCRPTHKIPAQCWAIVSAGSMPVNRLRRWPNSIAYTWHSPNAVSMLTHSLRRWPDIESVLGDCTLFCNCCIVMRVTLSIPAPETPDNMIHRPNADVMLGHRLQRWASIIAAQTFF